MSLSGRGGIGPGNGTNKYCEDQVDSRPDHTKGYLEKDQGRVVRILLLTDSFKMRSNLCRELVCEQNICDHVGQIKEGHHNDYNKDYLPRCLGASLAKWVLVWIPEVGLIGRLPPCTLYCIRSL